MATTAICGTAGTVGLGGEIVRWTLNLNQEAVEVTSTASSGNREYIPCLKSADGTLESYTCPGAVGASAACTFITSKLSKTMNIIITSLSTEVDVKGAVKFTASFVSNGAIT